MQLKDCFSFGYTTGKPCFSIGDGYDGYFVSVFSNEGSGNGFGMNHINGYYFHREYEPKNKIDLHLEILCS
jgi:hypothetical protein